MTELHLMPSDPRYEAMAYLTTLRAIACNPSMHRIDFGRSSTGHSLYGTDTSIIEDAIRRFTIEADMQGLLDAIDAALLRLMAEEP